MMCFCLSRSFLSVHFIYFISSVPLVITVILQIARKHRFTQIQSRSNHQRCRTICADEQTSDEQTNKLTECDRPPHTLAAAPLLPVPWVCGHHVDGALPGRTLWPYRTFANFPRSLIDFLLRSCQADQKIAFSSRGISRFRVFKMFSVIAPWQSFLPWSGLYIMDCHEIIIACLDFF